MLNSILAMTCADLAVATPIIAHAIHFMSVMFEFAQMGNMSWDPSGVNQNPKTGDCIAPGGNVTVVGN